jgi:hypothetical protein
VLSLDVKELIAKINKSVEDLDLVTTRKYLEGNLTILNENNIYLKSNARELLLFLTNRLDSGEIPFTRKELISINSMNNYASRFDLRGLKLSIKNNAELLLRKDIRTYLNSDAQILLEGMDALERC